VPPDQCLRPNNQHGLEDRGEPAIELDEEQPIAVIEPHTTTHLAPQHNQLLRSAAFSASSRLLDLKNAASRLRTREIQAIITTSVPRFHHQFNADEVFGTHRLRFTLPDLGGVRRSSFVRVRQKTCHHLLPAIIVFSEH
jgi:hypothetical protein